MVSNEDKKILMFTDARGVYIPRDFAEMYVHPKSDWTGMSDQDEEILRYGPEHEDYWQAWEYVLNSAKVVVKGHTWTLHQDGDLWAIRDDYDWEEDDE